MVVHTVSYTHLDVYKRQILPIVTKQRDRFRTRNLELETQLKKGSQEQSRLKAELKRLKQDNSTLYERVKILSSYSHGSNRTTLSDLESPFSAEYEENMHPLADFKQRELDRYERKKMPPLERLFLSFAKIILANKNTRMLFMLYCVGLHGLVVIMTIYVTSFTNYITPEVGSVKSKVITTSDGI